MITLSYNEWLGVWVSQIRNRKDFGKTPAQALTKLLIYKSNIISYLEEKKMEACYELSFKEGDVGYIDGCLLGWFKADRFIHNDKDLVFKLSSFLPEHLIGIDIKENVPLFSKYLKKYEGEIIC